jgi:ABC-type lipoprotein release transport system permease subunit
MRALLYGVEPLDPATYVAVVGLVGIVVTLAAWAPARRAAGIDPMTLMRAE